MTSQHPVELCNARSASSLVSFSKESLKRPTGHHLAGHRLLQHARNLPNIFLPVLFAKIAQQILLMVIFKHCHIGAYIELPSYRLLHG